MRTELIDILYRLRQALEKNRLYYLIVGIMASVITIALVSTVVVTDRENKQSALRDEEYQKTYALEQQIAKKKKEYFEKVLRDSFSKDQLAAFAQMGAVYQVVVNGEVVNKNSSILYTSFPTIDIIVSENFSSKIMQHYPVPLRQSGSLIQNDNALNLLKISAETKGIEPLFYDEGFRKSIHYKITNLKVGEIVTVEFSDELTKKLGLNENAIEIFYNKAAE